MSWVPVKREGGLLCPRAATHNQLCVLSSVRRRLIVHMYVCRPTTLDWHTVASCMELRGLIIYCSFRRSPMTHAHCLYDLHNHHRIRFRAVASRATRPLSVGRLRGWLPISKLIENFSQCQAASMRNSTTPVSHCNAWEPLTAIWRSCAGRAIGYSQTER